VAYTAANKMEQDAAREVEKRVAAAAGARHLIDNEPFDCVTDRYGLEVKTVLKGKNAKITMHRDAMQRKASFARRAKLRMLTVVVDVRGSRDAPVVYYRRGVGSFRLSNMKELAGGLAALKGLLK
jgi:hypothetical protein